MVKGPLVDRLTASGRRLVELLDKARVNLRSALWLYRPESEDWVLVLALPEVASQGPRAAYRRIERVFSSDRAELAPLKLDDVMVVMPTDPLLQLLGHTIQTGPSISEIRFSQNRIGDTLIEDALIYRLQTA